ncbi:MAG TPA: hypothetical protein GXX28_07355, partial [Firmicutes bacterium]|nr:hypothetical protein [Bacillota bacterium]
MNERRGIFLFLFRAILCGPVWRSVRVAVEAEAEPGEACAGAYTRAVEACKVALKPVVSAWDREVAERRAEAERELEEYYRRCLQEE